MNENTICENTDCPDVNIWCPHTKNPMNAIESVEKAKNLYPNTFYLECTGINSMIIPKAGNIIMYTAGCE